MASTPTTRRSGPRSPTSPDRTDRSASRTGHRSVRDAPLLSPTERRDAQTHDHPQPPPHRPPASPPRRAPPDGRDGDRRPGPAARPDRARAGVGTRGHDRSTPIPRRTAGPRPSTRSRPPVVVGTDADLARIRANVDVLGRPVHRQPARLHQRDAAGRRRRSSWPGRPATSAPTSRPAPPSTAPSRPTRTTRWRSTTAASSRSRSTSSRPPGRTPTAILAEHPDDADRARDPRRRGARARRRGRRRARPTPGSSRSTTRQPPASGSATSPSSRARRPRRSQQSRAALAAAKAEGAVGSGLAWYEYQLGDTLIGTGDRTGAAAAYAAAARRPTRASHLAHWGLGRVAAADGRLDDAIARVSTAIAIVPLPEFLARRADLYRMRAADGDARREADDRKTVLAIAQLAGDARQRLRPDAGPLPGRIGRRPGPCADARPGRDRGPQGRLRLRCARLGAARQRPPGGGRRRDDHRARVRDPRREAALPRRHDRRRRRRSRPAPGRS